MTTPRMYDEDIPTVGDVTPERIRAAVGPARDAFWAKIAESFPEVTTGDMAPGDEIALEWAINETVVTWLTWNHPSLQGEDDSDESG
jgi:hypothetical protein